MSLTGKAKAATYKDLLQMNNSNSGVDTVTRNVVDGEGTASAISISDDTFSIKPQNDDTTEVFAVYSKDNQRLLRIDSSNDVVKAGIGQHIVNTSIQNFTLNSADSTPATTDWTAMALPQLGRSAGEITAGSSTTPTDSITIDGTTNLACEIVQYMWYVPFNITVDSCNVWFGADADTGDEVKFSVMSYTVRTDNGSASGDLSSGVENCYSLAAISGLGDEQAYFQELTLRTADVDAGKVMCAFVLQASSNSDLTANMQLVYHLR